MRNCTLCQTQSPDSAKNCVQCGADLAEHSATSVALARFRKNPRVSALRLIVSRDACPACTALQGGYTKDEVPALPVPGCSHPNGCRCFYEPALNDIYP